MPTHTVRILFLQSEREEELCSSFSYKMGALFLLYIRSVEM